MFNYLKEHWKIKDFSKIKLFHVEAYLDYKLEYYPSEQYMQKIISAIGKLEIALVLLAKNVYNKNIVYDFSIRLDVLYESRDLKLVANNYHNRAYNNPSKLITNLKNPMHQLAAKIQYEGGARIEGVSLIKRTQVEAFKVDMITSKIKGVIITKEKGGKEGEILVYKDTFYEILKYFENNFIFKINKQDYYNDLKQAAIKAKENQEASHGLRWNFAKRRMFEYGKANYSYQNSLQRVSQEMKHNRASITEHYLC